MKAPKLWVVSDTHFNHQQIINKFEFRKENYAEEICRKIRKNVKSNDILIHLWDVIFDRPSELKTYLDSMWPCTKILVRWNHDKWSDSFYYEKWFNFVTDRIDINNLIFTHIPVKDLEKWKLNIHWHNHTNEEHILFYANSSEQYVLYDAIEQNYLPVLVNNLIKQHKNKPVIKKTLWQRIFWYKLTKYTWKN